MSEDLPVPPPDSEPPSIDDLMGHHPEPLAFVETELAKCDDNSTAYKLCRWLIKHIREDTIDKQTFGKLQAEFLKAKDDIDCCSRVFNHRGHALFEAQQQNKEDAWLKAVQRERLSQAEKRVKELTLRIIKLKYLRREVRELRKQLKLQS